MDARKSLSLLLLTLAAGLAVNSLLGPFAFEVIRYRWSETILNQGIGLDAVSLVIVAPLCLLAALFVRNGLVAGPVLALGPASFTLYMMPQYVIGPEYLATDGNNERFFPLHFALFVVAGAVFLLAWQLLRPAQLPQLSPGRRRGASFFLLAFPFFLVFGLYLASFIDALSASPSRKEYLDNPTAFWIIAFLDLAIAAPAAAVSGWGLLRDQSWARKGLYAMVGWFALVPPSVAAMGMAMVLRDDPNGSVGRTIAFTVFAVVFASFAVWLYLPVLHPLKRAPDPVAPSPLGRRHGLTH